MKRNRKQKENNWIEIRKTWVNLLAAEKAQKEVLVVVRMIQNCTGQVTDWLTLDNNPHKTEDYKNTPEKTCVKEQKHIQTSEPVADGEWLSNSKEFCSSTEVQQGLEGKFTESWGKS